jgi:acyl-CoA thioesterase-1
MGERTRETGAPATAASQSAAVRADTPKGADRSRRSRVVLLGTSLTAGLGLDPELAYPALLQRKADSAGYTVRIVNAGLSGETSAGALRRAGWVLDQPASLVVLEVGANDGLRGVDPDSTYANIVALVQVVRTQRPEAGVVLMQMEAPTNLGGSYTRRFHQAYGRAATATGVTLLPFLLEGVAGDARFNQADGIHPNVEGSQRVAETVWRGLSPLLAKLAGG